MYRNAVSAPPEPRARHGPAPGEPVASAWIPLQRPEPLPPNPLTKAGDHVRTSDVAPAWMTRGNAVLPTPAPEWDWITYSRYAKKRHVIAEDTGTSFDAPTHFTLELRGRPPPAATAPYVKVVADAGRRVLLKPLVEVDALGSDVNGSTFALPVFGRPGFVPDAATRAALDGRAPAPRLGVTVSSAVGVPGARDEFGVPRRAGADRRGRTSAADVGAGGPVVDAWGGTARAGEAARRAERAHSIDARERDLGRRGAAPGGVPRDAPPARDAPGAGGPLDGPPGGALEPPDGAYYAWRARAAGEDAVYGAPGLLRGRALDAARATRPDGLTGHLAFAAMNREYGSTRH